jgi:hypothetical protein
MVERMAKVFGRVGMNQPPPRMYSRPTEAPQTTLPIRDKEEILKLHSEWARTHGALQANNSKARRVLTKARSIAHHALGYRNDDIVADLIRAADVIATRCDELSDRITRQEIVVGELAKTLGEEITRVRVEVARIELMRSAEFSARPAPDD